MTASFTISDSINGGSVHVTIDRNGIRISGECGHVNLSHHTLAAIFEESNGHRLAHVAELDPETDGTAILANVDRARGKMAAE